MGCGLWVVKVTMRWKRRRRRRRRSEDGEEEDKARRSRVAESEAGEARAKREAKAKRETKRLRGYAAKRRLNKRAWTGCGMARGVTSGVRIFESPGRRPLWMPSPGKGDWGWTGRGSGDMWTYMACCMLYVCIYSTALYVVDSTSTARIIERARNEMPINPRIVPLVVICT